MAFSTTPLADGMLADLPRSDWMVALTQYASERGMFRSVGPSHYAALTEGSDTLLVTFETLQDAHGSRETNAPLAFDMHERFGWSALTILADGATWFRDEAVYAFVDGLVDEGIFDAYENVVFYGAEMGGYGAAAFSVAAPGARLVAISPLATLDPRVAEWDGRFTSHRRRDFTSRYGYAPEMTDALAQAMVLYDPEDEMSAMHAALFTRPAVCKFRCKMMGPKVADALEEMDILAPLLELAAKGPVTDAAFARLYRARRNHAPYLRSMFNALSDDDRLLMLGWLSANVAARRKLPRFRRKMEELQSAGILPRAEAAE